MATSKKPVSLTRKALLDDIKVEVKEAVVDGKTLHCRPISEVRRTQRNVEAFDDNGKIRPEYMEKRRIYTIIDHLCDSKGEPMFTDRDVETLLNADSMKLDRWYDAIVSVLGDEVGNE